MSDCLTQLWLHACPLALVCRPDGIWRNARFEPRFVSRSVLALVFRVAAARRLTASEVTLKAHHRQGTAMANLGDKRCSDQKACDR